MTSLSKTEDGASQSKYYYPNKDTSALDGLLGLQRYHFHWMANTKVSVHRDTSEEEDGAIEVKVEEKTNHTAHEVPKNPAVTHYVTSYKKWQRQAVHKVCRGQVNHVY